MQKFISLLAAFILFLTTYAQPVQHDWAKGGVLVVEENIYIYGMQGKNEFMIVKYTKDLKKVAEASNQVSSSINPKFLKVHSTKNNIIARFSSNSFHTEGEAIIFDYDLKEINRLTHTKSDYKQLEKKVLKTYSSGIYKLSGMGGVFVYSDGTLKREEGVDLRTFNDSTRTIWEEKVFYKPVYYSLALEDKDEKVYFYVVVGNEENREQYILCIDKNSGNINYETRIGGPGLKMHAVSSSVLDKADNSLIIVGSVIEQEQTKKLVAASSWAISHGSFIIKLNSKGEIMDKKYFTDPGKGHPSLDIRIPFSVPVTFEENNSGNYDLIFEEMTYTRGGGKDAAGERDAHTYGFTIMELNKDLTIKDSLFILIREGKTQTLFSVIAPIPFSLENVMSRSTSQSERHAFKMYINYGSGKRSLFYQRIDYDDKRGYYLFSVQNKEVKNLVLEKMSYNDLIEFYPVNENRVGKVIITKNGIKAEIVTLE